MAKESYAEFIKNFKNWNPNILKQAKKVWDRHTLFIKGDAGERTPLVTGQLEGSQAYKKARVTKAGIVSSIVFTAPYANRIHNDPGVELAPVGTVYKRKGQEQTKSRKGEKTFLQNAVDDGQNDLFRDVADVIVKEFVKL
jgi:hypothetical protein